jgi:hypothetical protein
VRKRPFSLTKEKMKLMEDTAIFESPDESSQSPQPTEVLESPQPDQSQMYENRIEECILGAMDHPTVGE